MVSEKVKELLRSGCMALIKTCRLSSLGQQETNWRTCWAFCCVVRREVGLAGMVKLIFFISISILTVVSIGKSRVK